MPAEEQYPNYHFLSKAPARTAMLRKAFERLGW